jgi:hypothetical protein
MAAPRLAVELSIGDEDVTKLMAIARSRTEAASRVERARMLLASLPESEGLLESCITLHTVRVCCDPATRMPHARGVDPG